MSRPLDPGSPLPSRALAPPRAALLAALVAAAATASGCAGSSLTLRCPEHGGAPWRQLDSPHFRLLTDAGPSRARAALREFESALTAFERHVFHRPVPAPPGERVDLVLFDRDEDFAAIAPPGATGWYLPRGHGEVGEAPAIALRGGDLEVVRRRFQHELTHRFLSARVRRAPPWLEEGLADYYSTLRVDGDQLVVGELPMRRIFITELLGHVGLGGRLVENRVSIGDVPRLPALLGATHDDFHRPDREVPYYAGSWALVHLFMSTPEGEARLAALLEDLAGGLSSDEAFGRRFGDRPLAELDADYWRYLQRVEMQPRALPAPQSAPPPPVRERRLGDDEVHLLYARLRPWSTRENILLAGADLEAARSRAAPSPEVRYWTSLYHRKWRRFEEAERELRLAIAERRSEPRYLHALAVLLHQRATDGPPAQREAARVASQQLASVVSLLERLPASPEALSFVARCHLERGERDAAEAVARRAVALGPDCWECADTLARLSAQAAPRTPSSGVGDEAGGPRKGMMLQLR